MSLNFNAHLDSSEWVARDIKRNFERPPLKIDLPTFDSHQKPKYR